MCVVTPSLRRLRLARVRTDRDVVVNNTSRVVDLSCHPNVVDAILWRRIREHRTMQARAVEEVVEVPLASARLLATEVIEPVEHPRGGE